MFYSTLQFLKKLYQYKYSKYIFAVTFFAAGSCFATQTDSDMVNGFIQILDLIFAFLSFLMTPAIILAGWLLTPDWTMGDFFGLRRYFIDVWVLVSNIVYIIFALLLLVMAIVQIFGGGEAEYAFKQKLPKFLLGVLVVPFTWLIVSWTLSFANQATAAVLSIPMGAIQNMGGDTADSNGDKGIFHEKVIPTEIDLNFSDTGASDPAKICESIGADSTKCISAAEFVTYNGSGPFFIIMIYAYNIFRIQNTDIVSLKKACEPDKTTGSVSDSKTCIKNLTSILRQFGLALIVTFFFSVLLVALCWVLLMRAFKLWIYVMFSPLFGLAIFTGEGLTGALHSEGGGDHGGSGLSSVGFVPFVKLAMVPVLVSAVLSFGLLFVGVISNTFSATLVGADTSSTQQICTTGDFMVKYCIKPDGNGKTGEQQEQGYESWLVIGSDTTTDNGGKANGTAGDYTIVFKFDSMFSGFVGNAKTQGGNIASGAVSSVESIFAHIILTLISLVIIWMGVKAAVSYDEVTRIAFEPFAKFGDSVQHMVAHLPSHLPLPHPAFAALTPSGMESLAQGLREAVDKSTFEEQKRVKEFFSSPSAREFNSAAKTFNGSAQDFGRFVDDLPRALNSANGIEDVKSLFKKMSTNSSEFNSEQRALLSKLASAKDKSAMAEILTDKRNKTVVESLETQNKNIKAGFEQIRSGSSSNSSNTAVFGSSKVVGGQILLTGDGGGAKINTSDGSINGSINDPSQKTSIIRKFKENQIESESDIVPANINKVKQSLVAIIGQDGVDKLDNDDKKLAAAKNLLKAAG